LPTLANLKGCTQKPLFAAVPISNYIAPVLHLVIGIGNILVDSIFVWLEQIVEQLTEEEVVARNNILSAEINIKNSECYFNQWLENDEIHLTDCILKKKKKKQQQLKEKNNGNQLIIMDSVSQQEMNAQNKALIAKVKRLQSAKKQQTDRSDGLKKN